MSFIVSARKYRPAKFEDVVGQKSITTTLKNAIKNDKLAQSFLFCGPRGVGKTTCARILAKVINCENLSDNFEPCDTCGSCSSFNDNASFNIFELDAASNNSVDDIRNLIEQVRFAPQAGKYKIYIIDEVHMLSTAAFNAFLKTLEEPPSYAIFILATTEKHKILATILSRCQTFDFTRIRVPDMVEHLQYICKDQHIEAEEAALHIIAQKADGGLRDALSIYDRIASFSNGTITYKGVIEALNILDYDYYFKVTDALLSQNHTDVLLLFDHILQNGFEGDNFIGGLASHFRDLLICKDVKSVQLLEVPNTLKQRYYQQATLAPGSFLLSALNIISQCEINYKTTSNKRLQVELALLKITYITAAIQVAKTPATQLAPSTPTNSEKKNLIESSSNIAHRTSHDTPKEPVNKSTESSSHIAHRTSHDTPKEAVNKSTESSSHIAPRTSHDTPKEAVNKSTESSSNIAHRTSHNTKPRNLLQIPPPKTEGEIAITRTINTSKPSVEDANKAPEEIIKEVKFEASLEELEKVWQAYAKTETTTHFERTSPTVVEGEVVVLVGSQYVKDAIEEKLEDFKDFSKKNNLDLQGVIVKCTIDKSLKRQEVPKAITDKDRLQLMKEQNPKINDLIKTFQLSYT